MPGPICCWRCGICGNEVPAYRRRCPCQDPHHHTAPSTPGRKPR